MIFVQLRCPECCHLARMEVFITNCDRPVGRAALLMDGVVYADHCEFGAYTHTNSVLELRELHDLASVQVVCRMCFPRERRALGRYVTEARFGALFRALMEEPL